MCWEFLQSFIISHTGTWLQVKKDNIKDMFGRLELYLSENVHFVIRSGLVVTYRGLNRFRKVISTYLDLVTDIILLGAIFPALEGTDYEDNIFAYQVRNILLLSIVVPLLTSAFMTVYLTPLVILPANQWKKSTESKIELTTAVFFLLVTKNRLKLNSGFFETWEPELLLLWLLLELRTSKILDVDLFS